MSRLTRPKLRCAAAVGSRGWAMAHPYWPFFDLRVRTPRIELRPACSTEDITELARLAAAGIHPPEFMPFSMPWSDAPSPELERGAIQHYWLRWAQFAADK